MGYRRETDSLEEKRPKRNREPKENGLFLAVILTYLALTLVLGVLEAAGITLQLPLVLALILGELTLAIPTLLYLLLQRPGRQVLSMGQRLPLSAIPLLILMAYCVMPMVSVINLISMALSGENAAAPMLGTLQQLPVWLSLLCVAVLPGVVEEFIFRGLLYRQYRQRRVWPAILASAFLFGLMHMNLNQFCYAFAIGILFCLVYEATGSLLAPMLMHMVYNGNSVVLSYRLIDSETLYGSAELTAQDMAELIHAFTDGGQMLITGLLMAVIGLIGLAAAGGLYVAVVKLCGREKQVLLLFQRNAWQKRMDLESQKMGSNEKNEIGTEMAISRKIGGPKFWIGVVLSMIVIFLGVLLR